MESSEDSTETIHQCQPVQVMVYPTFEEHRIRSDTPPPPFIAHGNAPVIPERQNSFSAGDIEKQAVKRKAKCVNKACMKKGFIFSGLVLVGIIVGAAICYSVQVYRERNTVQPPQVQRVPEIPLAEEEKPEIQNAATMSWLEALDRRSSS